jgi:cell division transport system permease protein
MTPIRTAWHHIRRSPFQSLIAIIVMTISFFGLNFFIMISSGMASVLDYFETKPEITLFLKDGLDRSTVENLQKELSNYPNIREIKFISKEKALTIYQDQNKDNPMLTEMVTASILPASFEVSVSDPAILEQIAENFSSKKDQIDEIIYQKDIIKSLLVWTDIIRKSGIIVVSASSAITFLIIFVIIGMKITNRKEEISISRSLGASNFYVKRPFLFEGIFYGIVGSLIGTLSSILIFRYLSGRINNFFNPITFVSSDISFYSFTILLSLLAGTIIGYLASYFGVKRYIKF